jgi:HSP20 family molecular chaperone IbpA
MSTQTIASVKPVYQVTENAEAYNVTVQLPGVAKEHLEITGENGEVRIVGRRAWQQPESWKSLYRETGDYQYELVLTHDNAVDVDATQAELRDGILRLVLPKAAAAKARKIAVS